MTVGDWALWYFTAHQTIYLAAFAIVGFFVVWLLAVGLSKTTWLAPHNPSSVTSDEYVGFHAWEIALEIHLVVILLLGIALFYPVALTGFTEDWYLAVLYLVVILLDLATIFHLKNCKNKCA